MPPKRTDSQKSKTRSQSMREKNFNETMAESSANDSIWKGQDMTTVRNLLIIKGNEKELSAFDSIIGNLEIYLAGQHEKAEKQEVTAMSQNVRIKALEKTVESFGSKQNYLNAEVLKATKSRLTVEMDRLKTTVLISGIKVHANAKDKETFQQTRDQFGWVLGKLNLSTDAVPIKDALRFKGTPKKDPKTGKDVLDENGGKIFLPGLIKVVLETPRAKANLYKGLVEHGSSIPGINTQEMVPKEMLLKKQILEKLGYNFRLKNKGAKTRIVARNGEIWLSVKRKGETTFSQLSRPKEIVYVDQQSTNMAKTQSAKRPRQENESE